MRQFVASLGILWDIRLGCNTFVPPLFCPDAPRRPRPGPCRSSTRSPRTRRASVAKNLSKRHNSQAELMRLLHTTAGQLLLRGTHKYSEIFPVALYYAGLAEMDRFFLLCCGRLCCCSYCRRCSSSDSQAATAFRTVVWLGEICPVVPLAFLLCRGRLCCCCCCSYCRRCLPSDSLAATAFRTMVCFGFYTLAEKPASDVCCSTCRTRLRVCVLLATHIYRFLVFRCFHFKSIFQLLKQVFLM